MLLDREEAKSAFHAIWCFHPSSSFHPNVTLKSLESLLLLLSLEKHNLKPACSHDDSEDGAAAKNGGFLSLSFALLDSPLVLEQIYSKLEIIREMKLILIRRQTTRNDTRTTTDPHHVAERTLWQKLTMKDEDSLLSSDSQSHTIRAWIAQNEISCCSAGGTWWWFSFSILISLLCSLARSWHLLNANYENMLIIFFQYFYRDKFCRSFDICFAS